jgi:hypothetical protein
MWWAIAAIGYAGLLILAWAFVYGGTRKPTPRSAVGWCPICKAKFYVPHADHYMSHEKRAS